MLFYNGTETRLQAGDLIILETDNEMIRFMRGTRALMKDPREEASYWAMPSDGVQLQEAVKMIADACGLTARVVEDADFPTYQLG